MDSKKSCRACGKAIKRKPNRNHGVAETEYSASKREYCSIKCSNGSRTTNPAAFDTDNVPFADMMRRPW